MFRVLLSHYVQQIIIKKDGMKMKAFEKQIGSTWNDFVENANKELTA